MKKNVRRYNRKLAGSNKITMRGPDGTRIRASNKGGGDALCYRISDGTL